MQKITLTNIKIYLIHKLGGYTKEEYKIPSLNTFQRGHEKGFTYGYSFGINHLAKILKNTTDNINGCSKQEWIDKVYSIIEDAYNGNIK